VLTSRPTAHSPHAPPTRPTPSLHDALPISSPGIVCGTPDYMSPEQGRGDPLDSRSDLYALGVIMFQLLTSQLPFEAASPTQVVRSEEHTSELQSPYDLVCRLLLEKKKTFAD